MAKYCPSCHLDCGTKACPMDERGRCKKCGNPPFEAADRNRTWFWCATHDQWHTQACAEDANRHCCTRVAA